MIAALNGTVTGAEDGMIVLATDGGVCYEVAIAAETRATMIEGERVFLHTKMIGRDDGLYLYGFPTTGHRMLFNQLRSVSGVGPKVALLMSGHDADVRNAIQTGNADALRAIKGVGAKTAERITMELEGKL